MTREDLADPQYAARAKVFQAFCAMHNMIGDNLDRPVKFALTRG
ncbi:MAG: hypothetical protein ACJAVC_000552 [Brevundimonas sp.]|jgi:hypothetical protein